MKNQLVAALARLASLPYQQRYIIGGTVETYVLPEELVEDVDGLILRSKYPDNIVLFTGAQMAALDALSSLIDEISGEALSFSLSADVAEKIRSSPIWAELRLRAAIALELFGAVIDTLSVEDIDEGRIAIA
jgi:hypothetical protein